MAETLIVDLKDKPKFQDHLLIIKAVLSRGGVIAFPTDTYYGLGVNPFQEHSLVKIFQIKNRDFDKPLPVLVATLSQLETLAQEISKDAEKLIEKFWPGPLTILFKSLPHLPRKLNADTGKIGVRQPGNELTRKLIQGIGHPLTGTSANVSGSGDLRTPERVIENLGSKIELIADGGPTPGEKLSTLVDTTVSPLTIIREGAVSKDEIESVLKTRCISVS